MMKRFWIGYWLAIGPFFLFTPHIVFAQCNTCASDVSFTTNPEFSGSYALASSVDVNQGNSPETFVTSAYWQIYGSAPSPSVVTTQANNLRTLPYWRRIDVVNTFMTNSGRTIPRVYSEPWQSEPQLLTPPCKNVTRDVGAVCMFFFSCPGGTNCGMDWANTHVEGMNGPSTLLNYGANTSGVYTSASNAGFWERELLDARYAGLSYLLPNVYGPDITDGSIDNLASALATVNSMGVTAQVKIGMFDDTWGWTNFGYTPWNIPPWAAPPDGWSQTQINNAATIIYQYKWKAFFSKIPSQYWYEVNGHPLIYMYNAGTLPIDGSSQTAVAAIITQIKTLFLADFGVTPYVVIDIGFSYGSATVADNQFVWATLTSPYATNYISTYSNAGITADLAMVKWDPTGRDDNGSNAVATSSEGIIKDDSYLKNALNNTLSANFLTLATWNDLGEGTGINRCYDYYVQGQWEPPDYFMNDIRHSQSQTTCAATDTPTITSTSTNSPTPTRTYTLTATMTNSASNTPTTSNTATKTFSPTGTSTSSPTATLTLSPTPTYTKTATASATNSASNTATLASTATSSSTSTASPTSTFTKTFSPTGTSTWSPTAMFTVTSTKTFTATSSPTVTVTATATTTSANSATFTLTPTKTYSSTVTNTFTYTPSFTSTFTFTPTFTPTLTLTNSVTSTATTSFTPTITSTKPATATYTPTATSTKTFSPTGTSTSFPTATSTYSPPPIVFPNPVTGDTVNVQMPSSNETHVEIEIFTLAMRKVRTVEVQQVVGNQITIELTDMTGMRLADGLYYFMVQAGTKKWVTKVLVLR